MEELIEALFEGLVWVIAEVVAFLFGIWGLVILFAVCIGALIIFC